MISFAANNAISAIKDFTFAVLKMKDKQDKIKRQNRKNCDYQKWRNN